MVLILFKVLPTECFACGHVEDFTAISLLRMSTLAIFRMTARLEGRVATLCFEVTRLWQSTEVPSRFARLGCGYGMLS